jgi:hypothetical protein
VVGDGQYPAPYMILVIYTNFLISYFVNLHSLYKCYHCFNQTENPSNVLYEDFNHIFFYFSVFSSFFFWMLFFMLSDIFQFQVSLVCVLTIWILIFVPFPLFSICLMNMETKWRGLSNMFCFRCKTRYLNSSLLETRNWWRFSFTSSKWSISTKYNPFISFPYSWDKNFPWQNKKKYDWSLHTTHSMGFQFD